MAFSEQIEKERYQAQAGNLAQGIAGQNQAYVAGLKARRQSLRESIASQKAAAEQASSKANRLGELEYLLEKNPEVALILELMEDVRR